MNENTRFVVVVVCVAAYVRVLVHYQHSFIKLRGETLGEDATRKARPHHQVVEGFVRVAEIRPRQFSGHVHSLSLIENLGNRKSFVVGIIACPAGPIEPKRLATLSVECLLTSMAGFLCLTVLLLAPGCLVARASLGSLPSDMVARTVLVSRIGFACFLVWLTGDEKLCVKRSTSREATHSQILGG